MTFQTPLACAEDAFMGWYLCFHYITIVFVGQSLCFYKGLDRVAVKQPLQRYVQYSNVQYSNVEDVQYSEGCGYNMEGNTFFLNKQLVNKQVGPGFC